VNGETMHERVAFWGFTGVAWLGRTLPTHTGRVLFRWIGTAAFHVLPGVRATVAANQARVLGRPVDDPLVTASTREAFRRYARYWFDAFDVVDWSDELIAERFTFDGWENMEKALAGGRGVIAVLPHIGNWDAAGRAMTSRGVPVVAVAEELRPARLYELFLRHRRDLGMEIFGLVDGGQVGRQLATALSKNRVVALVADRDLTSRGVQVEIFGGARRLPAGPGLLSVSSGAPVIVAGIYETREGWHCVLHEPLSVETSGDRRADVTAVTREIARMFERVVSASPPDWHLFQPGWEE
jgi:lauroyl/myristoyl acyltransferase